MEALKCSQEKHQEWPFCSLEADTLAFHGTSAWFQHSRTNADAKVLQDWHFWWNSLTTKYSRNLKTGSWACWAVDFSMGQVQTSIPAEGDTGAGRTSERNWFSDLQKAKNTQFLDRTSFLDMSIRVHSTFSVKDSKASQILKHRTTATHTQTKKTSVAIAPGPAWNYIQFIQKNELFQTVVRKIVLTRHLRNLEEMTRGWGQNWSMPTHMLLLWNHPLCEMWCHIGVLTAHMPAKACELSAQEKMLPLPRGLLPLLGCSGHYCAWSMIFTLQPPPRIWQSWGSLSFTANSYEQSLWLEITGQGHQKQKTSTMEDGP